MAFFYNLIKKWKLIYETEFSKTESDAPEYLAANKDEKPVILEKYGIARSTLYAALKRYNLDVVKQVTLA